MSFNRREKEAPSAVEADSSVNENTLFLPVSFVKNKSFHSMLK